MPHEAYAARNSYAKRSSRPVDGRIAELAEAQHGVAAGWQLIQLGLDRHAIRYRIRIGRLYVVHRGVYAVGYGHVTRTGRCMAAVLAGGPAGLLSYQSGGWLWGLRHTDRARVDVTVPRQLREQRRIRWHVSQIPDDERAVVDGIPVTSMPRTLLDLASVLQPHQLERAIEQAEVLRLTDPLSLPDLLERYPRRRGTAALRRILEEGEIGATITRSKLERRFLAFVADAGLPRPEVNAPLHVAGRWIEVDCLWRAERLAVELDSRTVHGTAAAFERDRARDRELQAARWRPVRVTWKQLARDARAVEADLRALLATSTS